MQRNFDFGGKVLDLSVPRAMGILNVTPDSFSDGGELMSSDGKVALPKVLARADSMVRAGADILDVGGESTRPGAREISSQEEIDRVAPAVEAIVGAFDVIVSVDTSNPRLMSLCPELGAGLINDIRALGSEGALPAAANSGLPVCLSHIQGSPRNMQDKPHYEDVVAEVKAWLAQRVAHCREMGMGADKLLIDPGFGFGKTLAHNVALISRLEEFKALELPLLMGISRKSMIGGIIGGQEKDRVYGSLAAAVIGVMKGARIIRAHDVKATVDALKVCRLALQAQSESTEPASCRDEARR